MLAEEPEELIDDGVDELEEDEWEYVDDEEEEELPRKQRVLRSLRNAAISFLVLLFLAVGGGAAYVWYIGEYSPPDQAAMAKPVEPIVHREAQRPKHDPKMPFGASVQMLSTPVLPGDNADITIKSVDDVTCKIVVELNKIPLKDSGLADKKTDEYGIVSWSWTIPENAPLGKWPIDVTCTSTAKKSAMVRGYLEIVKTLSEN